MRGPRKLEMRVRQPVLSSALAIRKHHNSHNAVLCEDRFAKTDAYTLISHKDSLAVPGTPHMLKKSRSLVKTANATSKVGQTANWIRILTEAT